ncbi:hypothetical protein V8E53_010679 [Lactarius tabidus]
MAPTTVTAGQREPITCNGVVPCCSSAQPHCGCHVTAVGDQVALQQHNMPLHCGRHTATLPWDTDATTGHKSPRLACYTMLIEGGQLFALAFMGPYHPHHHVLPRAPTQHRQQWVNRRMVHQCGLPLQQPHTGDAVTRMAVTRQWRWGQL